MVQHTDNDLFPVTDFTQPIGSLVREIKQKNIEKVGVLHNDQLEAVVLSTEEYHRLKGIEETPQNRSWIYWQDKELDHFGQIAIGLSRNNYDDEDYSTW